MDRILNIIEFRGVIAGLATNRHGRIGRAMIGVNPRNNMFLGMFAATVLVKMNQAVSRINRRRTAARQGHMVEIPGRKLGKLGRKGCSGNIGHIHKGTGIGHLTNLIGYSIRHFVPAHSYIRTPESPHSV